MRIQLSILMIVIISLAVPNAPTADMVILKSGEMFQTRKAWREEDGTVGLYQNDCIVHFNASDVERVIQRSNGKTHAPQSPAPPIADVPAETSPPKDVSLPAINLTSDDTIGFLNLKWGQKLSGVEDLVQTGTDPAYGGVQLFTTKNKRRFGRAYVDHIEYGFWQDRLYTIIVTTGNFLDFRKLKSETFRRFGKGIQNRKDVEKYHWSDETTDRLLSYEIDSDTGFLWMRSREVHQEVAARYPD